MDKKVVLIVVGILLLISLGAIFAPFFTLIAVIALGGLLIGCQIH